MLGSNLAVDHVVILTSHYQQPSCPFSVTLYDPCIWLQQIKSGSEKAVGTNPSQLKNKKGDNEVRENARVCCEMIKEEQE
jgi:hypothetical protein